MYHSEMRTGPIIPSFGKDDVVPAVGVAALFTKDYYKQSAIAGECRYLMQKATFMPLPCRNVTVLLQSADKKILKRQQVDENGNFSFFVEQGIKYRVVVPRTQNLSSYVSHEVEMGERILVNLKRL